MSKAFVILRVSSKEQKKKYGFDVQWEDDILIGAEALGLQVSEELCCRVDESATKVDRAEFSACVREAIGMYGRGEIEALLFPRVDRESRDAFISIPLLNECFVNKLPVYFAKEELFLDPTDLDSKAKYMDAVNQSMAYVATMRRNTMRGRKRRVKNGLFIGGASGKLYGYDCVDGKRVVNPATSKNVKQIFQWFLEGETSRGMTVRLHNLGIKSPDGNPQWTSASVSRLLRRRDYTGKALLWGETLDQPALISPEEFERVQAKLKRNRELSLRNRGKHEWLLSGYLYCSLCGRSYAGNTSKKRRYYSCPRGTFKVMASLPHCLGKSYHAERIEEDVWQAVTEALRNPEAIMAGIEAISEHDYASEIVALEARLRYYKLERGRLFDAFRITISEDTFKEKFSAIEEGEKQASNRLAEIEGLIKTAEQIPTLEDINKACDLVSQNIERLSFADKRKVLEALRVKVYTGDTIRLEGVLPVVVHRSRAVVVE
jgi:site-specific DNA recombinase